MRRNIVVLLVSAVGAGVAVSFLPPAPLDQSTDVVAPVSSTLVCAPFTEPGTLLLEGADTVAGLTGDTTPTLGATVLMGQSAPSIVTGGPPLTGGIFVSSADHQAFVPCSAPRAQGTLLVSDTGGTDVLLVNPDASEAVVDLTLSGPDGEIEALGSRGIALAPRSTRVVALSVLAPGTGPVAVDFTAGVGRATVVARTDTREVMEAASATSPATAHLLPGIAGGATATTLLMGNPGDGRATVEVTAYGMGPAYRPDGGAAAAISVPAHSTVAVDLTGSLAGEPTGLAIASDVDVSVALATGSGTARALTVPTTSARELGARVPGGGILQLTNPDTAPATAHIRVGDPAGSSDVVVPAGATVTVPLEPTGAEGQRVAVTATAPLFGAVVLPGAVVPLTSAEEPPSVPVPASIVPTLR